MYQEHTVESDGRNVKVTTRGGINNIDSQIICGTGEYTFSNDNRQGQVKTVPVVKQYQQETHQVTGNMQQCVGGTCGQTVGASIKIVGDSYQFSGEPQRNADACFQQLAAFLTQPTSTQLQQPLVKSLEKDVEKMLQNKTPKTKPFQMPSISELLGLEEAIQKLTKWYKQTILRDKKYKAKKKLQVEKQQNKKQNELTMKYLRQQFGDAADVLFAAQLKNPLTTYSPSTEINRGSNYRSSKQVYDRLLKYQDKINSWQRYC